MLNKIKDKTAYSSVGKMLKAMEELYTSGESSASHPSVIVGLVKKAISADKPKTRYVAGKYARQLMWTRKLLGDRVYDRIVSRMVS